ncbi:type II secretion system protein [Sulfurovum sp.]|uniref:type IV pilus modification PilV family protein n=1 Tax=Sulfurovum sp. TaxID=1969726 RepID=UPI002868293B|nr:type II secretion system protein [Sulfurovum sp.]
MKYTNNRKAFSMLTAIVVIVLMATVAVLVMSLSGKMIKETTSQFQREQAVLLAKSYTEYAIMAVSSNDRNATGNCLTEIDGNNIIRSEAQGGFQARVRISYIGDAANVGSCGTVGTNIFSNAVTTVNTPLNIVIDVYVEYQALDHHDANPPWITYHKRTLQKI